MMSADCASLRRYLASFVDGELRGAKVLGVLDHLEYCTQCATEAEALRDLGERLRGDAPLDPDPRIFAGLATTIISRTSAEDAESWWGFLRRAREDWHWVLVGAGSVAATFASTTLLFVLLAFGTKPERSDSLSVLTFPQAGMALAMPVGLVDQSSVVLQVDDVGPMASLASEEVMVPFVDRSPTEADLVNMLLEVVTYKGHAVSFDSLDAKDRRFVDSLLREISRMRSPVPIGTAVNVRQLRFEVFTSVSARGL